MWFVLVFGACTGTAVPSLGIDPSGDPERDSGVEVAPGDTSVSEEDSGEPPDTGFDDPDYEHLFTLDEVHEIDLTLDPDSVRALGREPKEYVSGSVVVDGEAYENVGVRLKGSGSFQPLSGKSAFKIDFNYYDPDQSYRGKGKLTLNNMLHDETQLHEVVAYAAFAAAGLPASRVGYAWVTVNGEAYGLYSNVETPDRDYLEHNFNNRDGNLYEGGYPYYPDNYDHADFTRRETKSFQLESGTDLGNADLQAVTDALASNADVFELTLSTVVDIDQYARFQIVEAWTGQWDGYAFASNNFRVFVDHGGTGLAYMVPTGLDYCFTDYGGRLDQARFPLGQACQANADCNEHFAAVVGDTLAAIDAAGLEALMDQANTLVRPYVEDDPKNAINERQLDRSVDAMRTWIQTRSVTVNTWY